MKNLSPDLFQTNKFSNCYAFLIERARSQKRRRRNKAHSDYIYYESHHITPKSMGGGNGAENLILLTAREHFICHWLLTKMCLNQEDHYKMLCALNRMIGSGNYQGVAEQSHQFEKARKERSLFLSRRMTGSSNPMFGTTWDQGRRNLYETYTNRGKTFSEEEKILVYGDRIGATRSEETKVKISQALAGKPKTAEHIAKVQASRVDFTHSEEARQKISEANKGRIKSENTRAKYHATIAAQKENKMYCFIKDDGSELIMNKRQALEIGLKSNGINNAIRLNRPYKGFRISRVPPT